MTNVTCNLNRCVCCMIAFDMHCVMELYKLPPLDHKNSSSVSGDECCPTSNYSLSWSDIPKLEVPIMISLIEGCYYRSYWTKDSLLLSWSHHWWLRLRKLYIVATCTKRNQMHKTGKPMISMQRIVDLPIERNGFLSISTIFHPWPIKLNTITEILLKVPLNTITAFSKTMWNSPLNKKFNGTLHRCTCYNYWGACCWSLLFIFLCIMYVFDLFLFLAIIVFVCPSIYGFWLHLCCL